ncbi:MAG: carbon storage regulator [Gammaproteobacteria bacterium]|nr:carbon storage regulator [Gammaproteobacteria bacterium]MDH3464306.1 carbon storage regulator [Gammaproteobacteria bacterium]
MQIITRQVGDVIVRNDDVEIFVLSVDDNEVKLGIEIRSSDRFGDNLAARQLYVESGRHES